MNKRCTNSSCRRSFSTLNAAGKCPHCGKRYPQMVCSRINFLPGTSMRLHIRSVKGCEHLNIETDELFRHGRNGEKIRMIKKFRDQVLLRGYFVGLKGAKEFCESLMDGEAVIKEWHLTGEKREELGIIEPVIRKGIQERGKK